MKEDGFTGLTWRAKRRRSGRFQHDKPGLHRSTERASHSRARPTGTQSSCKHPMRVQVRHDRQRCDRVQQDEARQALPRRRQVDRGSDDPLAVAALIVARIVFAACADGTRSLATLGFQEATSGKAVTKGPSCQARNPDDVRTCKEILRKCALRRLRESKNHL
jgi:hypothetical protein